MIQTYIKNYVKNTLLTIGIVLYSVGLHAQGAVAVELQYHTANFKDIEWNKLSDLGIDRVILRTYQDLPQGGGLYFKNGQFVILADRLNREFIPLLGQNIKPDIFGWLIARRYNWLKRGDWYDTALGKGSEESLDKIDLFNPEAVDAVVKTFSDLVRSGVTGILIQDDLIVQRFEGFSNWGRANYTVKTGWPVETDKMLTIGTPEYQNWLRIKINQVNQIVGRIVKACKDVNPSCRVVMNIHYETPFAVEEGEAWYEHNLRELVATGLDELSLMAYHLQMAQEWNLQIDSAEFRERFRTMVERAQAICTDRLTLKLQIRDWKSGALVDIEELLGVLALCPNPVKRICLTPVKPGDIAWLSQFLDRLRRRTV